MTTQDCFSLLFFCCCCECSLGNSVLLPGFFLLSHAVTVTMATMWFTLFSPSLLLLPGCIQPQRYFCSYSGTCLTNTTTKHCSICSPVPPEPLQFLLPSVAALG
uniref:Secreted protein n=1 Tax=Rhipicephalus appendiculatus TaxID=34631 RepID=A0A131YWL9_RHIAP